MNDPQCIFCRIVSGSIPASTIYADDRTLAFMDLNQPTPGHVLIISKAHYATLFEISREDGMAVMETTRRVALAVKAALRCDGLNLHQANGKIAQQEVFHFHMHIFARYEGDDIQRLGMRGAAKQPSRAELDALAQQLKQALR